MQDFMTEDQKTHDIPAELRRRTKRNKQVGWAVVIVGSVTAIGLVVVLTLKNAGQGTIAATAITLIALMLGIRYLVTVRCPGCEEPVNKRWGKNCPECGAAGLKDVSADEAECTACGRTLRVVSRGKGGLVLHYAVNFCTSCGVALVEKAERKWTA